jgi:mannosyl-3-phosphoglycerate phosphatase family protein
MTKKVLIVSDLDGTLLNFKTFDFSPILPFILELNNRGVQLVLNSSKCESEILEIIQKFGFKLPYITENGSAIYIPKSILPKQPKESFDLGENWVIKVGVTREIINKTIRHNNFKKFMKYILFLKNMTHLQKSYYTGLKIESLERSQEKEFSEAMIWMGSNIELENFKKSLNEEGLSIVHGARLLYLTGLNTKGDGMGILIEEYRRQNFNDIEVISCGDSSNDLSMLENSDYSVVIRLPDKKNMKLKKNNNVFNSTKIAPLGWQEEIEKIPVIKEMLDIK